MNRIGIDGIERMLEAVDSHADRQLHVERDRDYRVPWQRRQVLDCAAHGQSCIGVHDRSVLPTRRSDVTR
jgi:hypothetical protein